MRKSAEEKAKRRLLVTIVMGVLSFLGAVFLFLLIFAAVSAERRNTLWMRTRSMTPTPPP